MADGPAAKAERSAGLIFGSATAAHYRQNVLVPFLAHYLKGTGTAPVTEALTFRTGANEWVQHDAWPPRREVSDRRLYLQANRKLSFDPPPANGRRHSTATCRIRRARCRIVRGPSA